MLSTCCSGVVSAAPLSTAAIGPTSCEPSRSTEPASSIALTTSAGVARRLLRMALSRSLSDCTRYTGPYAKLLSAAENPGAGLLFQLVKKPLTSVPLTIAPVGGTVLARGWTSAVERSTGTKPCHSHSPVPQVGKLGLTCGLRTGSWP